MKEKEELFYVFDKVSSLFYANKEFGKMVYSASTSGAVTFTKKELELWSKGILFMIVVEEWECGGGNYDPYEYVNPSIELIPVGE